MPRSSECLVLVLLGLLLRSGVGEVASANRRVVSADGRWEPPGAHWWQRKLKQAQARCESSLFHTSSTTADAFSFPATVPTSLSRASAYHIALACGKWRKHSQQRANINCERLFAEKRTLICHIRSLEGRSLRSQPRRCAMNHLRGHCGVFEITRPTVCPGGLTMELRIHCSFAFILIICLLVSGPKEGNCKETRTATSNSSSIRLNEPQIAPYCLPRPTCSTTSRLDDRQSQWMLKLPVALDLTAYTHMTQYLALLLLPILLKQAFLGESD